MFVNTNKPLHVSVLFIRPYISEIMNFVETIQTELLHYKWYAHTATYHINIQRRKSAEDIIVTAQSTAYGPLRMVE